LFDDYIDVKRELKMGVALENITFQGVEHKARLIRNGTYSLAQALAIALTLYGIAVFIGAYFTFVWGAKIIALAAFAALLCLFYPFSTRFGLGEAVIGLLFGPLLTYSVYFALTGTWTADLQLFSISLALLTVVVLHVHSLVDFEHDVARDKKTLCVLFKTKSNAIKTLVLLLSAAYLNVALIIIFTGAKTLFALVFLTLFTGVWLVKSAREYIALQNPAMQDFMRIFALARNLAAAFCIILAGVNLFTFFFSMVK
jgi:1,4-dihydroxy-2-naphthoate octaprenyltransferase